MKETCSPLLKTRVALRDRILFTDLNRVYSQRRCRSSNQRFTWLLTQILTKWTVRANSWYYRSLRAKGLLESIRNDRSSTMRLDRSGSTYQPNQTFCHQTISTSNKYPPAHIRSLSLTRSPRWHHRKELYRVLLDTSKYSKYRQFKTKRNPVGTFIRSIWVTLKVKGLCPLCSKIIRMVQGLAPLTLLL